MDEGERRGRSLWVDDARIDARGLRSAARSTAGGVVVMGILLVVLGVLALGATAVTGIVSVMLLGILLAVAGVLEVAQALRDRGRPYRGLHLTGGIFSVVAGAFLFLRPTVGLASIALLLALFFIANGLFHSVGSIVERFPGWGWDLAYGLLAIVLGVLVAGNWPRSSLWLLGTLVGLEILMRGAMLIAIGIESRRLLSEPPPVDLGAGGMAPRAS